MLEAGNGVPSHIRIVYKTVWSWDLPSIDGINRDYVRPETFGRPKLKLCSATDTRFSDVTNVGYLVFDRKSPKIMKNMKINVLESPGSRNQCATSQVHRSTPVQNFHTRSGDYLQHSGHTKIIKTFSESCRNRSESCRN